MGDKTKSSKTPCPQNVPTIVVESPHGFKCEYVDELSGMSMSNLADSLDQREMDDKLGDLRNQEAVYWNSTRRNSISLPDLDSLEYLVLNNSLVSTLDKDNCPTVLCN